MWKRFIYFKRCFEEARGPCAPSRPRCVVNWITSVPENADVFRFRIIGRKVVGRGHARAEQGTKHQPRARHGEINK